MTLIVRTPAEGYAGTVAGVEFVDGVGKTDDLSALAYFRRRGYAVEPVAPEVPEKKSAAKKSPTKK